MRSNRYIKIGVSHGTREFMFAACRLYKWIQEQRDVFTAEQVSALTGHSKRTVYRHMKELQAMDNRIQGEAGVGYLYRRRG